MTVTASTTRNDYTAGSAQNVYSYTFQLNEATDVDVYLDGVLQTLNTHYTVQNVGNSTGGTITFTLVDAENNPIYPTEGAVINILMAMDLDRDTAYQPSGAFLAADVNNDFDRLWLASNQQQTEINRTLRLQDTDITTANMELPQNSTRRNKLLGFNNDGNPVAVTNNQSNWDVAYDNMIVSTSFTDGNYTLTQQDGDTFTNNFDGRYFQNTGGNIYGGIDVNGAITSTGNLNITGTITASGYNNINWDSAYNKKITSVDYSVGTNTLTLEQQDGNSLTTTLTGISDIALSYNGAVKAEAVATGIDVTGTVNTDGLTVSNVTNSSLKLESTGTGLGSGAVIGDIQFYGNDASVPAAGIKAGIKVETVAALGDDAQMKFTTSDGTTNNIDRMLIANNGDISFYEDTGTTPKFFWDASTERLGIGTSNPNRPLTVESSSVGLAEFESTDSTSKVYFKDSGTTNTYSVALGSVGNEMAFYASSGGAERMRIDASGNVGIGTSNPSQTLDVAGNIQATGTRSISAQFDSNHFMRLEGNSSGGILKGTDGGVVTTLVRSYGDSYFNGGNVGIGTTSPDYPLDVSKVGTSGTGSIGLVPDSDNGHYIRYGGTGTNPDVFRLLGVGNLERMRIDTSGNVGIGTTNPNDKFHVANGSTGAGYLRIANNEGYARLGTDGGNLLLDVGGSEKMRIDSSGNLLVGKTANSIDTVGGLIRANGQIGGCVDGNYAGVFNRKTSDGDIVLFRKDNTTVGSIGVYTKPFAAESELTINPETGVLKIDHDGTFAGIKFADSTTSDGISDYSPEIGAEGNDLFLKTGLYYKDRLRIESSGDISFYEDTGTTPKLFWDASEESLGIGTTTPATELDVDGTITANAISLGDSESIAVGADDDFTITHDGTDTTIQNDTGDLIIDVNDSAGKLEIQHEGVRAVTITDSEVAFYMGSGSFPFFSISTANGPTFYSDIEMNGTTTIDGRDVSVDGAKLDKIPEKTIRTRFQKRGQSNTVGFLTLTNTLQNVGTVFRLNASVTTAVEHILDLNISANFLDINSTNDGEFIVAVTAPAPANETTVNLGTVISTSFTGSTFQFVLSGDLTKHFSPYCGMSVNSDGSSAFGFNTYDGWSYDPFYNRTTVECYLYQANKPTTGDTVYLHPFDWETSGTVLDGDTYPIEAYNALGTTNQNQFHQIYLGYYKDNKNFQIKAREVTTQENIQISRISGTYSNIIGI